MSRSFSREGFFLGLGEELESRRDLALSELLDADERRESGAVLKWERLPWLRLKGFVSDWRRKASYLECKSGFMALGDRIDARRGAAGAPGFLRDVV